MIFKNKLLNSSPEFLQLLLNKISEGIVVCDTEFNITFSNKKAIDIHAIPESVPSQDWHKYLVVMDSEGKDIVPTHRLPMVRALQGEHVVDEYYLLKRKNLPDMHVKYNASPLSDAKGNLIGAICTAENSNDLAKSLARFKAIFDQSPLSIQIVNKAGKTLLVNKAFQNLWSISDDFVNNFILKEYNILEDPILKETGQLDSILEAFSGKAVMTEPIYYDPRTIGLEGRPRWACATMYPLITTDGHLEEVVIIHQDITEQHQDRVEKELVYAKLEAIIKQMPAGVFVVGHDGEISLYNEKMASIIGEPQRAKNVFMSQIQRSAKPDEIRTSEVLTINSDGLPQILSVSSGPVFETDGTIKSNVVIATDITLEKRKLANQGLLDQLKSFLLSTIDYEKIVEKIASALIPYFADSCMIDVIEANHINRIVTKHRLPQIENVMIEMNSKYPPRPGSPVPSVRVLETGEARLIERVDPEKLRMNTVDAGHAEYCSIIGIRSVITVPIFIRGKIIGAISFFNTTDRPVFDSVDLEVAKHIAHFASLAIENSKLYKEAKSGIQLRDDFISIASHELKTPITSLNLQVEVLNSLVDSLGNETEVSRLMRKFLGSTNNQIHRLSRLVDDMLDISRISTGKLSLNMKTANIKILCLDVMERFHDQLAEMNIKATLHCDQDVMLQCDADRIDQVLTNFMTNAIRYGGKKPIDIIVEDMDNTVVIKVKDQGRGIYQEDFERIFKRFERAHTPDDVSGLGLGLYINTQIVEEHQGKIHLESEIGKGSTFIVELPRRK